MDKKKESTKHTEEIATALCYSPENQDEVPSVAALGRNKIAKEIRTLARRYGIPIENNNQVAGLLSSLDVGDDIPEGLYKDVASLLHKVNNKTG